MVGQAVVGEVDPPAELAQLGDEALGDAGLAGAFDEVVAAEGRIRSGS